MRHPGAPQNFEMGFPKMSSEMVVVVFGTSPIFGVKLSENLVDVSFFCSGTGKGSAFEEGVGGAI